MTIPTVLLQEPDDLQGRVHRRLDFLMRNSTIRTQAQLGARLGLPQAQVSKRLRGVVDWRLGELEEVAKVYGVDVGWLLGLDDRGPLTPSRTTTRYVDNPSMTWDGTAVKSALTQPPVLLSHVA